MILTRELRPLEHYSTLELSIYFNIMKIKLLMSTNAVTVKFDNPISKVKGIFEWSPENCLFPYFLAQFP